MWTYGYFDFLYWKQIPATEHISVVYSAVNECNVNATHKLPCLETETQVTLLQSARMNAVHGRMQDFWTTNFSEKQNSTGSPAHDCRAVRVGQCRLKNVKLSYQTPDFRVLIHISQAEIVPHRASLAHTLYQYYLKFLFLQIFSHQVYFKM